MLIPPSNIPSMTVMSDGDYTVEIWDANGCTNTSDPFHYVSAGAATVAVAPVSKADPNTIVTIPLSIVSSNNLFESGATNYVAKVRINGLQISPIAPAGIAAGNDWIVTLAGPIKLAGALDSI